MPIDLKRNFNGGLDLDSSPFYLAENSYVDALNITRDAIAGSHDGSITNIVGNRLVPYNLPSGQCVVIGSYAFDLRNTVVYFVWNTNGKHCVLEYNNTTRTIAKIFENLTDSDDVDILGFTRYGLITGVNIFPRTTDDGDLLFFLDSLGRPTVMNITRFKNGEYTPVTRDIIDVNKRPSLEPPSCVYGNDLTRTVNDLRNRLFRFKYVWVYDDFEESTTSPISAVPLPDNILDEEFTSVSTNNNNITISMNSGPKNVKAVMLLMSYSQKVNSWTDFEVVETIVKADESIGDNTSFSYIFYNDSTYPVYDPIKSAQLFSYVPELAKAQEMPNGNVLVYGAITEGYDRTLSPNVVLTVDTVPAGDGSVIGNLNYVHSSVTQPSAWTDRLVFSGVPAVGTVINVYYVQSPNPPALAGTYTTVAGDTASDVVNGLGASMDVINVFQNVFEAGTTLQFDAPGTINYSSTEIIAPSTSATTNSIPTWMWSTQRRLGLAYFDQKGRTNGVLYSAPVQFPEYAENGSQQPLIPFINAKIYHVPPIWAYSYQWVVSPEGTQWLFWECTDVNTTESEFLYFDISNMILNQQKNPTTAAVLNWSFVDGDRMRFIRRMSDDTVFDDSYDASVIGILTDPVINNTIVTGTFIKIRKVAPFDAVDYTSDFFVLQLYRPGQAAPSVTDEVFNEFSEQYYILDPGTNIRRHAGQVTDQSSDYVTPAEFNFYEGDSYFRLRTINISQTGIAQFNVQDRNFVDFYLSAVNSLQGRPSVIDINARRTYYSAMYRFGQSYEPNTNVNGLNLFLPGDFDEYDYNYGDIMRFKVRDRYMRVYQKFKVGVVSIFSQINREPGGTTINVVTDQLLNPIQYYSGDFGIFTAPESLASFNYADYFCDTRRGAICRVSQDGITPISITNKVNSWATENLPLRIGDYKIYGTFSQRLNQYIIALTTTNDSPAQTLVWSEDTNTFESFLSYHPENMCNLGTLLITFKNGNLYTHDSTTYNKFYGVQYGSHLTTVFNKDPMVKKVFNAIAYQSNQKWFCPSYGDIYTSMINPQTNLPQISALRDFDFELQENVLYAGFWRDANSKTEMMEGLYEGDFLNGVYISTRLTCPDSSSSELVSFQLPYVNYQLSPRNF